MMCRRCYLRLLVLLQMQCSIRWLGVENTMNYLGFLGGTNIFRSISVIGKYTD